jgi:hypothetical protein
VRLHTIRRVRQRTQADCIAATPRDTFQQGV